MYILDLYNHTNIDGLTDPVGDGCRIWEWRDCLRDIYLYLSTRTRPFFRYPLGGLPQVAACALAHIMQPAPGINATLQQPGPWLLLAL